MKRSQEGFISAMFLIIIVLLFVGGGTYFYLQIKQGAKPVTTGNVDLIEETIPAVQTSNSQTSGWNRYAEYGFQLQWPPQYEIHKERLAGSSGAVSFQTSDGSRVFSVNVMSYPANCKDFGPNVKTSLVTINGIDFVKGDVSNDFSGMETYASAVEYCVIRGEETYKMIPRVFFKRGAVRLDVDKDPVFNQMISTFKITPTITTASSVTGQNFVMVAGGTAHVWGASLVDGTSKLSTIFIGGVQVSALPPPEISNTGGLGFVVPSSLVAGQSYELYVSNSKGISNVVRVKILGSPPISTVPTISYIDPTSVKVGDTITVHGSNLYGTIFALDDLYGTTDSSIHQDPSGTFFSFVVPMEMRNAGTHNLRVNGVDKSVTFIVHQ